MELDNLRAALAHGLRADAEPDCHELALRTLAASAMFWVRSGQRREGWQWVQSAMAVPAIGRSAALRDHALGLLIGYGHMGKPEDGLTALRRSRQVLSGDDEDDGRRRYLSLYNEHYLLLRTAPRVGDDLLEAMRGTVRPHWGALQRRHLWLLESLRLRDAGDLAGYSARCLADAAACREAGGRAEAWPCENSAAQGLVMQGRWAEAAEALDRALAEVRSEGLLREQVPLVAIAATVHLRLCADAATLALAREAMQLLRAEGMGWWMADSLPWAAWHQGRASDALRLQAWADPLVQRRVDACGPVFSRLRSDFDQALARHAGAAALPAMPVADIGLSEGAATALALGPG